LASTAPQLADLLSRYAAQHPRRARGGLSAIAGIDFQLRCYLADFASELARGSHLEDAGAHFLEAFSDYTKSESQQVVCVQVKRTLTKKTLGDAADEAVVLDKFFETEAPNLRGIIVYETLGLLGRSDGSAPDWNGVQLPDKKEEDWQERQGRFESMLGAGRFRPPCLVPDPWWRIIAVTWQVLDDPFAFAREALEICMRRGMEPEAAAQVRSDVAEAFARRRRGQRFPGHIVTPTDVEATTGNSREVLLGQIPTLRHLQDGRFMDRSEQVKTALERLDLLVGERDFRCDPYIYALWIEGRSGNGKSILLLQLVQRLVRERMAQVIWLDDAGEHLLPILEAWAGSPVDSSPLTYVFVDDFYAPGKRARVDFPKISRLLREQNRSDWPILVTCGPPEQRQEWKASSDNDAFRTAHWLLPAVGADEKNQLRLWFRSRTGEEPKSGPAFLQVQGLMISMVFEMREGELAKFGRRFRARLENLGLVDALTLPLAVNRLYLPAPGSWLDERQNDALRRLNEDQDFSMMNLGGRHGEFVRVTHPHLSNAIYEAVRELDDSIVRARDLHRAFTRSMASGEYTTARLILSRIAGNHERLATLDADELARGMTRAWLTSNAEIPVADPDLARFWTNWAVWSARQPLVSRLLGEQPLDRAREALAQRHVDWAVLWATLWESATGHSGLVSDAQAWLKSAEGLDGRHWSLVWEKLFGWNSAGQDLSSLVAAAADWLRENEFGPDWNFVFRPLAMNFPELAPWSSALRLLDDLPSSRNWPYVFQSVANNAAALGSDRWHHALLQGWEWLGTEKMQETPEWSFVWQKLVELRAELPEKTARELLPLGHDWLAGRENRDAWAIVWEKLVELRAELPEKNGQELLPLGHDWLAGREDRDAWSFVWRKLVELRAELPEKTARELLLLGHDWLAGREDRDEWSFVWRKLVELRAELPEKTAQQVLPLGHDWLAGSENRDDWSFVWQKLVELRAELPEKIAQELLPLGHDWLAGRENRDAWAIVWQKLVELRAELPEKIARELLPLGHDWLAGREDRDAWSFVWQKLVEQRAELPEKIARELLPLGHDWLAGREDRDAWSFVWRKLVELRAELPEKTARELLPLGHGWLAGREDRDAWSFVWQKLVELRADLPEKTAQALNALAWGWLVKPRNADRGEWDKLWEACFRNGYREITFLASGSEWVLSHNTLPQSPGLAGDLLDAAGGNWLPPAKLVVFCRNWLSTNTRNPSWTFLFGPLWDVDPSSETAALVPLWLDASPPEARVLWVIERLLRSQDVGIVKMLKEWVDVHAGSSQSTAIRKVVDRHRKKLQSARKSPQ
jgi:hypothetical protein